MEEVENSNLMRRIKERVKFPNLDLKEEEIEEQSNFGVSDYWMKKVSVKNPDIYKLIDQLIKEGKNQGYKISVTIE